MIYILYLQIYIVVAVTWTHLYTFMLQSKPLNVEYLMMDASVLLPPTGTPLTGIDFVKRLPCGDVEKTRRVRPHVHAHSGSVYVACNTQVDGSQRSWHVKSTGLLQ